MHWAAIDIKLITNCVNVSVSLLAQIPDDGRVILSGCPFDDGHVIAALFQISSCFYEHLYDIQIALIDC